MKKTDGEIVIEKLSVGTATVWIKGLTPLVFNAMSAKARHELLFPAGRKTAADKAQNMKHNPIEEYRGSVYAFNSDADTRLAFPATAFKSAICTAALEQPGVKKSQVGRLTWVEGDMICVYGAPQIYTAIVRSADMNKTPDVRTRAILPRWCCRISIRFVRPTLNETMLARLIETAGLVIGIGDYRQEKGKGNYGQFEVSSEAECADIVNGGGRVEQDAALENPVPYDRETSSLLAWFEEERVKRGR